MREILKEVVNEQGLQILQTPAMLRAKLEEKGDDRSDALLWELILTACPSVADVAVQPELSRAEVNTVIGAVTKTTMLSASLVRRMVQQLLDAAQVKLSPVPRFLILANGRHGGACSVEDQPGGRGPAGGSCVAGDGHGNGAQRPADPVPGRERLCQLPAGPVLQQPRDGGDGYPAGGAELLQLRRAAGLWPGYGALADYALNGAAKESSPGGPVFWVSHIPGGPGRQKVEQKRRGPVGLSGAERPQRKTDPAAGGGHAGDKRCWRVFAVLANLRWRFRRWCWSLAAGFAACWTGYGPLRLLPLCVCRPGCLLAAEHPMPGLRGGTV